MASIELLRSGSLLLSSTLPKVVNRSVNSLRPFLSRCRSSSPVVKSMRSMELLRSEPPLLSFTLPESSARPPVFSHLRVNLLTALPPPPPEPPDPPDSRYCSQPLFCPPSCTPDSGLHPLLSIFPPPSPSLATAVSPDLLMFIAGAWPIKPCLGRFSSTVLESSTKPSPEVVNFVSILSISPCKRPTEVNELLLALWFPPPLHSLHRLVPLFVRMLELLLASAPAIYQKIKLLFWLPSASFYGRMMMLCADESFVGIFPKASLSVVLDQSFKSLSSPVWACFGCWLMCVGFVPLPPMVFCGSKEKRVYIPFGLIKTLQLTPYNFLTAMSSCVVSTPPEEATGLVSTISGGRS